MNSLRSVWARKGLPEATSHPRGPRQIASSQQSVGVETRVRERGVEPSRPRPLPEPSSNFDGAAAKQTWATGRCLFGADAVLGRERDAVDESPVTIGRRAGQRVGAHLSGDAPP